MWCEICSGILTAWDKAQEQELELENLQCLCIGVCVKVKNIATAEDKVY